MRNPLAPSVYLLRNLGKTGPLMGVIVLAVMLIVGIVAMMNSIPLSIRTIYAHTGDYFGLTARGESSLLPDYIEKIKKEAPVPIGRIMRARASEAQVKSIVGGWPYVVVGLNQSDMRYYMRRIGNPRIQGAMPAEGKAEAVISEPIARNLDVQIGDIIMGPDNQNSYSPYPVKVVGILDTKHWIIVSSYEYYKEYHRPNIDVLMVFAEDKSHQRTLDRWAEQAFKGKRSRLYAGHLLESETNSMFAILYKILDVVIGTLVVVITLMMGMLMNIYQSQRIQEFGLLQALGYTQSIIRRRLFAETIVVVLGGWILGVLCSTVMLRVVQARLMHPSAFAIDVMDGRALSYTVPVPVAIFVIGILTLIWRFRKFDPVGIVERRLV